MRRFGQLLGFAQRCVRMLRDFPTAATVDWFEFSAEDLAAAAEGSSVGRCRLTLS